jgi:hypothetical protein
LVIEVVIFGDAVYGLDLVIASVVFITHGVRTDFEFDKVTIGVER